jgi:hypothetical protein
MHRTFTALFATVVIAGVLVAGAVAHGRSSATLTIRHQARGCHTWSFAGGRSAPAQRVTMTRGGTLRVVDNDVMPHRLVQTRGAHVRIVHAQMSRTGATASVRFTRTGVYKFKTKAGEDYPGVHAPTTGEDYVLRLTVTVVP